MPVVTDRFVYPRVPKTGSTHLDAVLRQEPGYTQMHGAHDPLSRVPIAIRQTRTVIATVRPPVDWYPSLYAHLHRRASRTLEWWTGSSAPTFRQALRVWTHPDEAVRAVPPVTCSGMREPVEVPLYTAVFGAVLDAEVDVWIPTALLDEAIVQLELEPIPGRRMRNPLRMGDYADMYDADMAGWLEADESTGWAQIDTITGEPDPCPDLPDPSDAVRVLDRYDYTPGVDSTRHLPPRDRAVVKAALAELDRHR